METIHVKLNLLKIYGFLFIAIWAQPKKMKDTIWSGLLKTKKNRKNERKERALLKSEQKFDKSRKAKKIEKSATR